MLSNFSNRLFTFCLPYIRSMVSFGLKYKCVKNLDWVGVRILYLSSNCKILSLPLKHRSKTTFKFSRQLECKSYSPTRFRILGGGQKFGTSLVGIILSYNSLILNFYHPKPPRPFGQQINVWGDQAFNINQNY